MVEVRADGETGDWNVIAPRRASRPDDGRRPGPAAGCPFCRGNEAMTPPEVLRVPAGAADWRVRVVPNLYAAVAPRDPAALRPPVPDGAAPPAPDGEAPDGAARPFTGRHEVVVESGRHDWDLRRGRADEVAAVLFATRERCRALAAERPAAISVFRNYGARAGASLAHPHSQIVALDQAPPGLSTRWRRTRRYHERTGRCLHDDDAAAARRDGGRVVLDDHGVLVYQPRAGSVPHQTTLLPPGRGAGLADADDGSLTALAATLPRVLAGLAAVLDDPAYNLVVHAGPTGDPGAHRWYRWHLTVYPRVTTRGGLELATGVAVNPSDPERTAAELRQALTAT